MFIIKYLRSLCKHRKNCMNEIEKKSDDESANRKYNEEEDESSLQANSILDRKNSHSKSSSEIKSIEELKTHSNDLENNKNKISAFSEKSLKNNSYNSSTTAPSQKEKSSDRSNISDTIPIIDINFRCERGILPMNFSLTSKNSLFLGSKADNLKSNEKEEIKDLDHQDVDVKIDKTVQENSSKHKITRENFLKKQKNMPKLREKGLKKLNDTIDKTQACIFCQFPIDENDISFSLLCKHRSCFICIYNKLQDIIGGEENQFLLCTCDTIIYIYLLSKDIELDSLDLYVEMISRISKIDTSIKCCCPYDLKLSKKSTLNENNACKSCNNNFCQKCGLAHITQTCLEYYNEIFKEELKANLPKCTECDKNNFEVELGCECQLCLNCCRTIVKDFLYNEDPIKDSVCIKHKIIIPRMYIYQAFGGQNFFIKEQEKAIDFMILSPKFDCEICLIEFNVNQSITLDCDHRFCGECMKSHLSILMKDSSFANKIGCPKCNSLISYEILKSNSDPDIFERYLKFSVMAFKPEDNLEVMKWCVNCDYGCAISIDQDNFKCPNCESEYCPKCNKKHLELKCEDARLSKTADELKVMLRKSDEFFKNFMKDYIECPSCGEAIQKKAGCNFLTCTWPRCKGICFCAICNKVLTKDQHYSHFKVTGPFGVTCNTTDDIEDE